MSNANTGPALSAQTSYPVSQDWLSELRKIKQDGEAEVTETEHQYAALRDKVDREIVLAQEKHQIEMDKLNKQLTNTIIRHKSKLYSLQSHLEIVQARVAAAASLIAPIHSLPNEILTLIFTFMCSSEDFQMDLARYRIVVPPFSLAMVCHRWYDLVHRCAPLWSGFSLPAKEVLMKNPERDIHSETVLFLTTKKLLKLSGSQPLSIDLDVNASDLPSFRSNILSLSNRWRELRVGCSERWIDTSEEKTYENNMQILKCLCGNLQNLESLTVDCPIRDIVALQKELPKLNSLSVFSDPERSSSSMAGGDLHIPWNQITKYTASGNPLEDILECVAAATNLETLVITNFRFPDESVDSLDTDEEDLPVVSVPTLRHLTATTGLFSDASTYRALFNCLQGTELSTLVLHMEDVSRFQLGTDLFEHGLEIPPFLRFLSTSSQTLVSLSLQLIPLKQSHLRFVLGSLPELTTLELLYDPYNETRARSMPETYEYSKLESGLVDALSERSGSPVQPEKMKLVPKLQHLTLQYMDFQRYYGDDTKVLDMVRTRCAGLFQQQTESLLRSAHITIREHHFSSKAVEAYRVLRLAGLCMSLQGKDGYIN